MFYNRKEEIDRLETALQRKHAQLIVLYGRRRCGKSTLVKKVLKASGCYHLAVQGEATLQRSFFARTLESRFPGFSRGRYDNWRNVFEAIIARGGERFPLVIDEFPYLVGTDPSLSSILQGLLEQRERLNFHLLLCGSSQQMMADAVLSATAPLYGRADEVLKVVPLRAGYLSEHLPNVSPAGLIAEYSVWGGVPRYWEFRSRYSGLEEAVRSLLLHPAGLLYDEPRRLLLDDVRSLQQPISLLNFVAEGAHRLSEIGVRAQKSAAELSRPLNRLVSLGYIEKEKPYGAAARSTKKTLYKVADPFMRFYHRFVLPSASLIELDRQEVIWKTVDDQMNQYVGQCWESLCREAVGRGGLGKEYLPASRWWGGIRSGEVLATLI